jgi:hypothetical protein
MVKVKSFTLFGIECYFPSLDHEPPHFHAKRAGEWNCKVFFLESRGKILQVVKGEKRLTKSQRKELLNAVATFRAELMNEWEEMHEERNEEK